MQTVLNLHGLISFSRVNGPGLRYVVFFQGCARGCPGCFNPETHGFGMNKPTTVSEVILRLPLEAEGLTISGGEPFSQPRGLLALLEAMQRENRGLSAIVYTGFTLEEIKADKDMAVVLPFIDVLVAGPFDASKPEKTALARGSSNQTFHFLSSRYSMNDFYMPARLELTIGADGSLTGTGFASLGPVVDCP